MGLWSIVLPDTADTKNYIPNPSIEIDTTNWEGIGGYAISQSTTDSYIGHACIKVTTTTDSIAGGGAFAKAYPAPTGAVVGYDYTISAYVKGGTGFSMRLALGTTDTPTTTTLYKDFVGTSDWQKVWVSGTQLTNPNVVSICMNNLASGEYLIDGVMLTVNDRETIYIDGDQEDCHWYGQAGLSQSYREENARSGGQVYNIEDDLAVYVNSYSGIGQPTATHLTLSQPLIPGALYQGRKIEPRVISIEADFSGSSLESMHALRKTLMQYINPDLTDKAEVMLRYDGAGRTMYCRAVYDSGLEFGNPSGFDEVAPIRFIAYDPFFYDEGQSAISMTGKSTLLGPANGGSSVYANKKGQWDYVRNPSSTSEFGPSSTSQAIYDISVNKYGEVWVGGNYTHLNGTTNGAYLSYFLPELDTWYSGNLNADNVVRTICHASDGKMYIGGDFSSRTGDSDFSHIGYLSDYSPARSWNHMGTGLGGNILKIIEAMDGSIYAVGSLLAYATTNCEGFVKWNGSAFSAPTTSTFTSSFVSAIAEGNDGKLYLGGLQLIDDGGIVSPFSIYNVSAGGFEKTLISNDVSSIIYDVSVGSDGAIYVAGSFTTTDLDAAGAKAVAIWNGARFEPLGSNPGLSIGRKLFFDDYGNLWVLGSGTYTGTPPFIDGVAVWNGYVWTHPDISEISNSLPALSMEEFNGIRYIGTSISDNLDISTVTTATNTSQALVYPVFKCKNSTTDNHTLLYLENNTTGKTIYLGYTIKPNEEVRISFIPGKKEAKSSVFGNIWQSVLKGSDVGEFYLRPGYNRIVFFADTTGTTTLTAYLEWTNTYLSVDEGA